MLADRASRLLNVRRLTHCRRKVRIDQHANHTDTRRKFTQQPKPLRFHQVRRRGDPSGVAARSIKTFYKAKLDGISSCRKYDWDCRSRLLGSSIGWVAADGRDHIDSAIDEFSGQGGESRSRHAPNETQAKRSGLQ